MGVEGRGRRSGTPTPGIAESPDRASERSWTVFFGHSEVKFLHGGHQSLDNTPERTGETKSGGLAHALAPALLRRQRQEDQGFQSSLGVARICLSFLSGRNFPWCGMGE